MCKHGAHRNVRRLSKAATSLMVVVVEEPSIETAAGEACGSKQLSLLKTWHRIEHSEKERTEKG